MAGSTVAELKKRFTKKSGKDDPASAWCAARLAQVEQRRAQFALGESVPIGGTFAGPFPPLYPYATAWWDERGETPVHLRGTRAKIYHQRPAGPWERRGMSSQELLSGKHGAGVKQGP